MCDFASVTVFFSGWNDSDKLRESGTCTHFHTPTLLVIHRVECGRKLTDAVCRGYIFRQSAWVRMSRLTTANAPLSHDGFELCPLALIVPLRPTGGYRNTVRCFLYGCWPLFLLSLRTPQCCTTKGSIIWSAKCHRQFYRALSNRIK